MRPPQCDICHALDESCVDVVFSDYEPLTGPDRFVLGAFPRGLGFYCGRHAPLARKLRWLPERPAQGYLRYLTKWPDGKSFTVTAGICVVCHRSECPGEWCEFKNDRVRLYSPRVMSRLPLMRSRVTHRVWLCNVHLDAAKRLKDLPVRAALGYLFESP